MQEAPAEYRDRDGWKVPEMLAKSREIEHGRMPLDIRMPRVQILTIEVCAVIEGHPSLRRLPEERQQSPICRWLYAIAEKTKVEVRRITGQWSDLSRAIKFDNRKLCASIRGIWKPRGQSLDRKSGTGADNPGAPPYRMAYVRG